MYRICYLLSQKYIIRILISVLGNVIALLLSAPFTILLLILHFVHFVFKWTILIIQNRSRDSEYFGVVKRILKGADCGWLEERWQESVLQAVLVFDSKINVRRIQELITTRVIPLYPRLTYRICPLPFTAGSVHCWLPDHNYDINRHVFTDHVDLSNDQLQNYVSKLISKKLPTDKSPWELRVLSQSIDCSSTDTIIILRVHQSLADGMTLIKILCTKLADTRASYTVFKSRFKFTYYLRLIQAFCIGPALIFYKLFAMYKRSKTSHDKNEEDCSVNWSTSVSICKIDRIKQVTRSSYNCVFLTAVTGGLRYVLQDSGIKHPPDLKITLPFVTGKSQKFIPVSTHIPISMEGAIPRLWKTKHQLKSLSSSLDLLLTSFVIYVLMPLCPAIYIPYLNKLLHKSANVQFTSIVGPATRLVIDGSPLKTIYPLLPCQSDLGISTAISTYVDQVYITVITHKSLENIGKKLLCYIEEQIDRMHSLLVNRTIPEDLGEDYFQSQFPDISGLPAKELKSRMQVIQHELQRLSEMISYNDDDVKRFSHFKSEFNHIFKELRRRKSVKVRRPSKITQTFGNFTLVCTSRTNIKAILFPFKNEINEETMCSFNESNKNKSKFKQTTNLEDSVQMLFYKKYTSALSTINTSKGSFRGCNYSNTNKYIYLTLVNENSNLDNSNNNRVICNVVERNDCLSTSYMPEFSRMQNQSLFYELSHNEQII